MKLDDLLARCPDAHLEGDGGQDVRGITHDSRLVGEGDLFAALPGMRVHGLDYLDAAVGAGAAPHLIDADPPPGREKPWVFYAPPPQNKGV